MRYRIILSPLSVKDLKHIRAYDYAVIKDKIMEHLSHQPTKTSKTLIKKLTGLERPQYRLRIGDYRVFYDVAEKEVHVLAVVSKSYAKEWLEREDKKE